jgi:hypothetical protein
MDLIRIKQVSGFIFVLKTNSITNFIFSLSSGLRTNYPKKQGPWRKRSRTQCTVTQDGGLVSQ